MRGKLAVRISNDPEFTEAALNRQHVDHRLTKRARLAISTNDVARMVAEFDASHGITKCKPAYAALSPHYRV